MSRSWNWPSMRRKSLPSSWKTPKSRCRAGSRPGMSSASARKNPGNWPRSSSHVFSSWKRLSSAAWSVVAGCVTSVRRWARTRSRTPLMSCPCRSPPWKISWTANRHATPNWPRRLNRSAAKASNWAMNWTRRAANCSARRASLPRWMPCRNPRSGRPTTNSIAGWPTNPWIRAAVWVSVLK